MGDGGGSKPGPRLWGLGSGRTPYLSPFLWSSGSLCSWHPRLPRARKGHIFPLPSPGSVVGARTRGGLPGCEVGVSHRRETGGIEATCRPQGDRQAWRFIDRVTGGSAFREKPRDTGGELWTSRGGRSSGGKMFEEASGRQGPPSNARVCSPPV